MAITTVGTCSEIDAGNNCLTWVFQDAYLLPIEAEPNMALFLSGGFDATSAELAFGGALLMMATGFTVGIIISHIRKMRI